MFQTNVQMLVLKHSYENDSNNGGIKHDTWRREWNTSGKQKVKDGKCQSDEIAGSSSGNKLSP